MQIFYSHPVSIFGTQQEIDDLVLIGRCFPKSVVINPNSIESNLAYKEKGMVHFLDKIRFCDILVFRGTPDGKITAGVMKEIQMAKAYYLPVLELPYFSDRDMTVAETREYLIQVGVRKKEDYEKQENEII